MHFIKKNGKVVPIRESYSQQAKKDINRTGLLAGVSAATYGLSKQKYLVENTKLLGRLNKTSKVALAATAINAVSSSYRLSKRSDKDIGRHVPASRLLLVHGAMGYIGAIGGFAGSMFGLTARAHLRDAGGVKNLFGNNSMVKVARNPRAALQDYLVKQRRSKFRVVKTDG